MGAFRYTMGVGAPDGSQYEEVEALVDTGASYTVLPSPLLHRLGVIPHERAPFRLAYDRIVERDIGQTWVRGDGSSYRALARRLLHEA